MPYNSSDPESVQRNRTYQKRWYEANKALHKERTVEAKKRSVARNLDFLFQYLKDHPCTDCGEPDIVTLEFDHVRDTKVNLVTEIAYRGSSLRKIQEEIDKCDVVCANCHCKRTAQRGGYQRLAWQLEHA